MATDQEKIDKIGVINCPRCSGQAMLLAGAHLFYRCEICESEFTTKLTDVLNILVDTTFDRLTNRINGTHEE